MLKKQYNDFYGPSYHEGMGKDIKWCSRQLGGKRCMLCHHHAKFSEWSKDWHWFYMTSWSRDNNKWGEWCRERSQFKLHAYNYDGTIIPHYIDYPKRYFSVGLNSYELNSIIRKGCKNNRKCRCSSIVQRAEWFCPECYTAINRIASYNGLPIYDVILADRKELKQEYLILLLSGTL